MTTPQPTWNQDAPPEGSWRSLFKWGAPGAFKHPRPRLIELLKRTLGMEAGLGTPARSGLEPVRIVPGRELAAAQRAAFQAMLGEGGLATDGYTRLQAASGKAMLDLLRLREGLAVNLPEAVLYPRNRHDVARIVAYCAEQGLPVTARGGGSSVTRGLEAPRGGVSLDLTRHMNRVLAFSETDQTVTVEPGLYGPELERILQAAPSLLGASRPYTFGHFPQSFEHATVGGWVVTRGAGQNSTYYGKIEDLVLSQEYVTPSGVLRTGTHPAAATGPDTDQILMGSEGHFGILTEVTLRLHRHLPENRRHFSYLFPDWVSACAAAREVLQGEGGFPSVFRLSDPEETEAALTQYGVDHPLLNALSALRGLKPGRRCLLLGTADGEQGYARNVARMVARAARANGALGTTGRVTRAWEQGRFTDPYLRDDLLDVGILTDTLECAVTWDNLARVRGAVRSACHARPRTLCLAHLSHGYPQGASLYFIFITRLEGIDDYLAFQASLLDTIRDQGAALSHHHGIGRMAGPWLEGQLGTPQMDLFRAIKRHLDPTDIMNPGGTLGLDLPPEARR